MNQERESEVRPLSSTSYIAKTVLTEQDAIATHIRGTITLLLAARMHESLSDRATQSIRQPEQCSIGKWLLAKDTLQFRGTTEYLAVRNLHTSFHGLMLRIANLLGAGDFDQAERILNSPDPFQNSSSALANAIMALGRRVRRGNTDSTGDGSGEIDPRAVFSQRKPHSENSRKGTGTVESV